MKYIFPYIKLLVAFTAAVKIEIVIVIADVILVTPTSYPRLLITP